MTFERITRCTDLTEANVAYAVKSRERTELLLKRLAEVARPNEGAPKILLLFARMSTTACDWLEGDLRIEIAAEGDSCRFKVTTELGLGMQERVIAPFVVSVPLIELTRAVELVPRMVLPLAVAARDERRLVLSVSARVRKSTMPPPAISIAEECLIAPAQLPIADVEANGEKAADEEQAAIDAEWE
jgi:hypothetical protein